MATQYAPLRRCTCTVNVEEVMEDGATVLGGIKEVVHKSISSAFVAGYHAGAISTLKSVLNDIQQWHSSQGYNRFEHRTIDNIENYLYQMIAIAHMNGGK